MLAAGLAEDMDSSVRLRARLQAASWRTRSRIKNTAAAIMEVVTVEVHGEEATMAAGGRADTVGWN